ncbi:hypothetical protein Poly21_13920 [Allorhodopirellula heiligendammensis]|uniref:Uncharacterized protein n=1 Tax=Allorhodopirellula heiligendammensis TaxID=2714739 RepID=A0A5C6C6V7_9BACT|nr:hypothetical protein Poly21_13920 [Allorhodopirellula heiligendammensis]
MMSGNTTKRIDSIRTSSGMRPLEFCADFNQVPTNPAFDVLLDTKTAIVTHSPRAIEAGQHYRFAQLTAVMNKTSKQIPYV